MWTSVSFIVFFIGLCIGTGSGQFLNNRPFPTYSLENMPDTGFTCRDKILGGYYADSETQCQMFHICVKVAGVGVQDFRFLCPNGTAFDQDHQICAEWDDVDCDATTLYYASDNFDLYRIGSGFESKAVKYGEDEETFSLQRAETGDARLNREHQTQRVNQQKELKRGFEVHKKNNHQNNNNNNNNQQINNNDRDIFRGSSSSNFFNNRNGGKEPEDDAEADDDANVNQNRDFETRRKVVRKQQHRRPASNSNSNQHDGQTQRPNRQFTNNFAGSSYVPTSTAKSTTAQQQYNNQQQQQEYNHQGRSRGQQRQQRVHQDANEFRQNAQRNSETKQTQAAYTVSTPAPFKQTQQFNSNNNNNNNNNQQYNENNQQYNRNNQQFNRGASNKEVAPTTAIPKSSNNYPSTQQQQQQQQQQQATKQTENYPSNFPQTSNNKQQPTTPVKQGETYPTTSASSKNGQFNGNDYEVTKVKPKQADTNHPSTAFETKKSTTPYLAKSDNSPSPFSAKTAQKSTDANNNYPTTFAPRTNAAYTQLSQQSPQQQQQQQQRQTQKFNANNNNNGQSSSSHQQNQRTSPFTQYTPTVPKVTTPYYASSTPATAPHRANKFDETQYDDGSYNAKYDNNNNNNRGQDEEFLKTAHSTNIANSRNEYAQREKGFAQSASSTQKPRPFSVSANTPKPGATTQTAQTTQFANTQQRQQQGRTTQGAKSGQSAKTTQFPDSTPFARSTPSAGSTTVNARNTAITTPFAKTAVTHQQQQQGQSFNQGQRTTQHGHNDDDGVKGETRRGHNVTPGKNEKNASYDYAYYDTNVGSEPEYDIDAEFGKTQKVKKQ